MTAAFKTPFEFAIVCGVTSWTRAKSATSQARNLIKSFSPCHKLRYQRTSKVLGVRGGGTSSGMV